MTFMLTSFPERIAALKEMAADLGSKVRIVPPVPMVDLAQEVNQYDLEVMFYPPTGPNVEFALPNKFFEAIQGRLGLVIGESPMMLELVNKYNVGAVVTTGWTAADLAKTLDALTPEKVAEYKANSMKAARELNAEAEGRVFLDVVGGKLS
jgi:hypothetical protein